MIGYDWMNSGNLGGELWLQEWYSGSETCTCVPMLCESRLVLSIGQINVVGYLSRDRYRFLFNTNTDTNNTHISRIELTNLNV